MESIRTIVVAVAGVFAVGAAPLAGASISNDGLLITRAERPEKPQKPEKVEKVGAIDFSVVVARAERAEKPQKPEKVEKLG